MAAAAVEIGAQASGFVPPPQSGPEGARSPPPKPSNLHPYRQDTSCVRHRILIRNFLRRVHHRRRQVPLHIPPRLPWPHHQSQTCPPPAPKVPWQEAKHWGGCGRGRGLSCVGSGGKETLAARRSRGRILCNHGHCSRSPKIGQLATNVLHRGLRVGALPRIGQIALQTCSRLPVNDVLGTRVSLKPAVSNVMLVLACVFLSRCKFSTPTINSTSLYSGINRLYAQNSVFVIVHDESVKVYLHIHVQRESSAEPSMRRTLWD